MNTDDIAITYSINNAGDSAVKEISRGIKAVLKAKPISLCILFFTPHYQPLIIREVLAITLRPKNVFALGAPMVIFQNKVLKKGIVCCCFSDTAMQLRKIFVKDDDTLNVEHLFRKNTLNLKGRKKILFSAISPKVNIHNYLRGIELALGKNFNIFGAGFMRKYGTNNFQILNDKIGEGVSSIIASGDFDINSAHIGGFRPLGIKFTITKVAPEKNRIIEIDGKPAAFIYRKYLQDKFSFFKKTDFCSFYPIGISQNNGYNIIHVIDLLEDDSIFCFGNIKENMEGNIMLSTPKHLMDTLEKTALEIKNKNKYNTVIVFDSLLRRRILRNDADKEISELKYILGEDVKLIGLYCDYQVLSGEYMHEFSIENHHLSMILLNN